MIYIDSPYNIGNNFVYEDDFSQSVDEYIENSGRFDDEGRRLVKNCPAAALTIENNLHKNIRNATLC